MAEGFSACGAPINHGEINPALTALAADLEQKRRAIRKQRRAVERKIAKSLIGLPPVKNKRFSRADNQRSAQLAD